MGLSSSKCQPVDLSFFQTQDLFSGIVPKLCQVSFLGKYCSHLPQLFCFQNEPYPHPDLRTKEECGGRMRRDSINKPLHGLWKITSGTALDTLTGFGSVTLICSQWEWKGSRSGLAAFRSRSFLWKQLSSNLSQRSLTQETRSTARFTINPWSACG